MTSLNDFEKDNVIVKENLDNHDVVKYQFQAIDFNASRAMMAKENDEIVQDIPITTSQISQENTKVVPPKANIEKELIDKLLLKTDELSSSLAKLQIQFEKQQIEMEEKTKIAREDGYNEGFSRGKDEKERELQNSIQSQQIALGESLYTLSNFLTTSQNHIEELEKELSTIAIDIAKEIIAKEVEENSSKIALELSKTLLKNIMDASNIVIKTNPQDFLFVQENLKDNSQVEVVSDGAITRGGVIITSSKGNLDGTIMARYKNLKMQVLENLE